MNKLLMPRSAVLARAKSLKTFALLLAVIAATVGATTAQAQPFARTWVSNTGTDTSNTQCSVTAPCLTFAHAITETLSGGEINCLNPGGFGPVTIAISVTIDCEGASNGGIMAGGTPGVTVNTAGVVVNLIGLDINGGGANSSGVLLSAAAAVNIRNCKIYGFSGGERVSSSPQGPWS